MANYDPQRNRARLRPADDEPAPVDLLLGGETSVAPSEGSAAAPDAAPSVIPMGPDAALPLATEGPTPEPSVEPDAGGLASTEPPPAVEPDQHGHAGYDHHGHGHHGHAHGPDCEHGAPIWPIVATVGAALGAALVVVRRRRRS